MEKPKAQKYLLLRSEIQKWLDELPEEIPFEKTEELIDKIQTLLRIERGRKEYREGQGIPHEKGMAELLEKLKQWSR